MDIKNELLQLVEIGIPMILFIFLTLAFCGFIPKGNKFFKNTTYRLGFTFLLIAMVCGRKALDSDTFPMDNKIFQALAEIASVLSIPLLLTIVFDAKHESKTKTVTTETVKIDFNGVEHYEKTTTVTEEE